MAYGVEGEAFKFGGNMYTCPIDAIVNPNLCYAIHVASSINMTRWID